MIRHNDELLLHVELIDVSTGSQLWGEQFKEHYSDVLEDPETLADKICDRLRPILAPTANSEETNDLDTQRNQAGGAFESATAQSHCFQSVRERPPHEQS